MKRALPMFACLASLTLVGLLPSEGYSWGLLRKCCRSSDCCAPVCEAAPAQPAPAPKMKEVKVTRYKQVWKEKDVTDVVCKSVPREEKFTYTVMVPKHETVTKKVTYHVCQTKEVDTTWTVMVPKCVPETRTVKYCDWQTSTVVDKVPVCRLVPVKCVDECGRCCTKWERVTEIREVTRCVSTPIHKTKEITVNVVKFEQQQRTGKKCVVETVPMTKDVTYTVCNYEKEQRTGVRTVCDVVRENVTRKVKYCEMVPYEETIQVQECATSNCGPSGCGQRGGFLSGLFHRRGCD